MVPSGIRRPARSFLPRYSPSLAVLAAFACLLTLECCAPRRSPGAGAGAPSEWFTDQASEAGLDFVHFNGMTGEFYYPEVMSPGVALFDYDNDGDLDVFVVQDRMLDDKPLSAAMRPPKAPLTGRLFRNDLEVRPDGRRTLKFTDVTEASGIRTHDYPMGVATGDFNNDGCVDLYITALGRNQMWRNNCDGTFTDVSNTSGTDAPGWSVSAAFVDYDRDGWLDLFVANYVSWSVETNTHCYSMSGNLDYCPPDAYRAQPSRLYHNNRDGTFTEVTARAGMSREFGPALGVSIADFDGDGWPDIYVTNDLQPNQLWINQHDGTFKNTAFLSGAAVSSEGKAKSSMGVDAGDFDNDGDEDLFITELTGQGDELYVNDGTATFEDRSARALIHLLSLPFTGFGAAWFDFDNDGWLDVLAVSGAVTQNVEAVARHETFALGQRKQLFRNLGNGRFEDVTGRAGAALQILEVSRGAAFGDIDNDGDTDVVVGNNSGPMRLLINNIGNRKHWIGLRLVGPQGRDMVGARVQVVCASGRSIWRRARADGSYASANDPRVLVGLGDEAKIAKVRVIWPDGRVEERSDLTIDRYTTWKEGTGR